MVVWKVVLAFFLAVNTAGCATQPSVNTAESEGYAIARGSDFIRIALDKPAHFTAADGETLLAPADEYVVEQADESHLRLTSEHATVPLVITAVLQSHDLDIPAPFVLAFSEKEDEPHVVLLLPDGRALDAVGSFSGIQFRDIIRTNRRYTLQTGAGALRFTEGTAPLAPYNVKTPALATTPPKGQLASVDVAIQQIITDLDRRREKEKREQSRAKDMEDQNALPYGRQSIISDYSRAQILAQAALAAMNEPFHLEYNINRPGGDFGHRTTVSPEACRAICSTDSACQAFTFVKPPAGSTAGQCYLKRSVPTAAANPCCISAKRKSAQEELAGNIAR